MGYKLTTDRLQIRRSTVYPLLHAVILIFDDDHNSLFLGAVTDHTSVWMNSVCVVNEKWQWVGDGWSLHSSQVTTEISILKFVFDHRETIRVIYYNLYHSLNVVLSNDYVANQFLSVKDV